MDDKEKIDFDVIAYGRAFALMSGEGLKHIPLEDVDYLPDFEKDTKYKKTKYGHEISCRKGLWSVCAPTKKQALNEAGHYYRQYFDDGEYND